jgi:von Willebrand factor type A domain
MTFDTPGTLTSGGVTITWMLQPGGHTLIGKAGETTIIEATITDAGAYNVTLSGPIDHSDTTKEDTNTFSIPVNVSDGHTTTSTTLSVTVEDDSPKAQAVPVSVNTASDTNVMLIIDVSGSMDSDSGLTDDLGHHLSRLDVVKAAVHKLLDQYADRGDVRVQIVKFSTSASQVPNDNTDWINVADAEGAIDALSAGGSTNYDAALLTAMTAFTADGKLSGTGTQNVSYFLSDGEPTTSSDWPQTPGPPQLLNGIQANEQAVWESFLTDNNIVSFALGISDATNVDPLKVNLAPIAFDPASGTQEADTPKIVDNLNDLDDALVSTASTSGSLLNGANSFGGDGGYVKSITIDGVTYTFNPAANG